MKNIKEIIESLPVEIQQLISSPFVYEKIEEIGNEYHLHIDQMGELDSETRMLLMGETSVTDFVAHISQRLEVSLDEAKQIRDAVNTKIFTAIKESLRLMYTDESKAFSQQIEHDPAETLHAIENWGGDVLPAAPPIAPMTPAPTLATTTKIEIAPTHDIAIKAGESVHTNAVPAAPTLVPTPTPTPTNFIDQKLTKIVAKPTPPPYKVDPYREPVV